MLNAKIFDIIRPAQGEGDYGATKVQRRYVIDEDSMETPVGVDEVGKKFGCEILNAQLVRILAVRGEAGEEICH
jgi:hypothetical protein